MTNIQTYYIHDNGGIPFKVLINDSIVEVYKNDDNTSPIQTFFPNKIFIGESKLNPMTKFSGCHGDEFLGNSILLEIDEDEDGYKYEFIGQSIFSFHTIGKIVTYESPVGNNDVPYPYAIDEFGNVFLLIEDIVLIDTEQLREIIQNEKDPYNYYYSLRIITTSGYGCQEPIIENFEGITKYYIDDEEYILTYNQPEEYEKVLRGCNGQYMYIVQNGVKIELTKEMYISLMERFRQLIKVEKLYKQEDVARI